MDECFVKRPDVPLFFLKDLVDVAILHRSENALAQVLRRYFLKGQDFVMF